MEFLNNAVNYLNQYGAATLTVIQVGGFWIVVNKAYLEISKHAANEDIPKVIKTVLIAAALILVLFKARGVFVSISNM